MEIRVLGVAWAKGIQGEQKKLKAKEAALLSYLALKGPTSREQLVGLLWPESYDATARNNLRQLLRRLRELLGDDYVEGRDPLMLRAGLTVDAVALCTAFWAKEFSQAASFKGELLESFIYRGCESLEDWLREWRQKLHCMSSDALEQEVLRLEQAKDFRGALDEAQRLRDREPTAERAYRHMMRLFHLLGDLGAALKTYRECEEMMRREFGERPSLETRQLLQDIEHHEAARKIPALPPRSNRPLFVEDPPVLAGREREWCLMDEAWRNHKHIFVEGEAGIGKTRLIRDFLRGKGRCVHINAKPGDECRPFSTHARNFRTILALDPNVRMKPWVRRELSWMLSEELDPDARPKTPEEKSRLFTACIEFLRKTLPNVDIVVFDDAQYMDSDSAELGVYAHSQLSAAEHYPLIINAYRTNYKGTEPVTRKIIHDFRDSDLVARVPVSRLDRGAVIELLRGMGEPALERIVDELTAYTDGKPFFIVETVRHLLQSGTFDGTFPASLSRLDRDTAIISHRLKHLSEPALSLARVFAVARTDFSAALASHVLKTPLLQLVEPWRELETANIFRGEWFIHDLVAEAILSRMDGEERLSISRKIDEYYRRPR